MNLSDFDYYLPKNFIAQEPIRNRELAKLLVIDLERDLIEHLNFNQIYEIINARLFGKKTTGGKVELLVLPPYPKKEQIENDRVIVECLVKGKVRPGLNIELDIISKSDNKISVKVLEQIKGGRYKIRFDSSFSILEFLSKHGKVPLPPYIKKDMKIPERYQTIYSKNVGSVAAPTAGLHFTKNLLTKLHKNRINLAFITLHISYGTFTPVRNENISQHKMESEYGILSKKNADIINRTRASSNNRLVAVGTTSVRTLESAALKSVSEKGNIDEMKPWEGWTDLFIHPGFEFRSGIDILITNFHLPRSTLLMLVSAFAGREKILKAYQEAIENKYRFYSLGDAMMIIK
jgi:S-adenosylmethionine:tRNA ribosyltransferase-isomerase